MRLNTAHFATLVVIAANSVGGCGKRSTAPNGPAASASAAEAANVPAPIPEETIRAVVNPGKEPVYSGPIGALEGTIRVEGDPAPDQPESTAKIGRDCLAASAVYGKLFREGNDRALADVMVAVTGYRGFVPARAPERLVEARRCAWDSRTIALTFGQRIDVKSRDGRPYLPELLGAGMASQMVAIPGSNAVHLYPPKPGRYVLTDTLHPFINADVLVVKFPTFAVTGLDGKYRIDGIPAGPVKVSAFLPATHGTTEQEVTIVSAATARVDLVISFDRAKYDAARAGAPPPPPSAPSGAAPPATLPAAPR